MISTINTNLRRPLFESWLIVVPIVTLIAIAVNFAPFLIAVPLGICLFSYFWRYKSRLVIFLLIYTPLEEVVLKTLPDSLYAPVRFMWEGILFATFGLMILENVVLNRSWKTSIIDKLVILFIGGWFISGFYNNIPILISLFHIKNLIRYIALFYIVYNLKPNVMFLKKVIFILIAAGVVQSILCIGQAIEGDMLVKIFRPADVVIGDNVIRGTDIQTGSYHTRFTGTFARANDLGNYLAFVSCFLAAAYFRLGKKTVYLLAFIPILTALFLTSSRISWISLFIGIGVILIKIKHKARFVYFIAPAVIVLVLVTSFAALDYDNIYSDFNIVGRFIYMFSPDFIENISDHGRLYVVLNAVPAVFFTNPVLGLGPGSFMNIAQFISGDNTFGQADALGLETKALYQVHDVGYAALFIQVGFLGLVSLILIFFLLHRKATRLLLNTNDPYVRALALGATGFFSSLAIQNIAGFNLMYRNQSLVIWTIGGLVALFATTALKTKRIGMETDENNNCQ